MHSVRLTQDQSNEFLEMRSLSENDMDVFYYRELQGGCSERASFSRGHWTKKRQKVMCSHTFIILVRLLFPAKTGGWRFERFMDSVPYLCELQGG